MPQFDRLTLGRQAKELGFVRDTFEKVCRLVDVLSLMESDPALRDSLALKGGTNTDFFKMPSVIRNRLEPLHVQPVFSAFLTTSPVHLHLPR